MTDALFDQLRAALGTTHRLERELGGGSMSRIFVAEDLRLHRRIVIKVLPIAHAERLSADRFEREILLAAGLQHPHIVPVLGAGTLDGIPYYTMPLVDGQTLRAALSTASRSTAELLDILNDVAEALEYAHARGIVHRDIKPENVLLSGRTAVVTDFGIAKALSAATATGQPACDTFDALTQLGTSLGTPAYMAPEQVVGDAATDHRADIYAWGMMAYEVLAGGHPFAHKIGTQALITAQLVETPAPLAERSPGTPRHVADIIMNCLAKAPDDRPASATEVIAALASRGDGAVRTTSGVNERSVVVIPFANLSADADNEYFSDGLTDELIADLSRIQALKVISRTSTMLLKGSDKSARRIAQEFRVRYVLEGSVRKSGSNLRITARLIDAASDTQLWADKFTGTLDDVFDLQERVSREIVRALDVKLSSDEDRTLARRSIAEGTAYDCFLRARYELAQANTASFDRATVLLNRGLEIAGDSARLRAMRAFVDVLRMRASGGSDASVLDAAAGEALDILSRTPDSATAHFVLGTVEFERGELQSAAASLRSALHSDPSDADAAIWLAIVYLYAGQIDAARATLTRLRQLDPLSPFPLGIASAIEWFDGSFEAGVAPMQKCLELSAESTIWRWHWAYLLALLGRFGDASAQAEMLSRTDPAHPYTRQLVAMTRAVNGDLAAARDALKWFDEIVLDPHITFHVAECHVLIGDHERAFALLESAVARGFYPYAFIARHDPFLTPVRGDPRFARVAESARRRWRAFVVPSTTLDRVPAAGRRF
jgi:eukaryotic-like serine/threonine-protein kinase